MLLISFNLKYRASEKLKDQQVNKNTKPKCHIMKDQLFGQIFRNHPVYPEKNKQQNEKQRTTFLVNRHQFR